MGDVQTRGGTIVQVAPEMTLVDADADADADADIREIDANGLTLLPDMIDPQVHFREPGLEHKADLFTASCACARGGIHLP